MSAASFGRVCRLTIAGAASLDAAGLEGPPPPNLLEQVVFDSRTGGDIRLTFEATSDDTGKPNQGKMSIYNLSPHTRSLLAAGSPVTLEAGYQGALGVVFAGFVTKVATHGDGPDIITDIEAADGQPFIRYGTTQRSYARAVSYLQVVQDLAQDIGATLAHVPLPLLIASKAKAALSARQFARGFVMSGACADQLTRVLSPLRLAWYVLQGQLCVVSDTEPLRQDAVVLSADTGMIGVPSRNENAVMVVTALMDARITVGSLIAVQSKEAAQSGVFKVSKTQVQGDTHGGPWNVNIEAALGAF